MARPHADPSRRRARTGLVLLLVVIVVALYGVLASTNGWPPFAPTAQAGPAGQVVRLRGSNTIGEALAPGLATAYLTSRGATDVAQTSTAGTVTVSGTVPGRGPTRFEIQAAGTETGFSGLADGSVDIGMASHRITDVERAQLAGRGDMTSPASEKPLAFDAVSVIVNPGRRVSELSVDQLRAVFSCRVTDWARLVPGQPPGPIRVLARDDNSGTYESFRDKVLGTVPLCPGAQRFPDNADLARTVADDPSAIGFVPLPSIGGDTAVALYDGSSKPTAPTALSVSTETYLLTRRLYLYVATNPPNPLAEDFAEAFALSRPGQQVVADAGYVSTLFPPPAPPAAACTAALASYCTAVAGDDRVPFDVRFTSGTDQLDSLAVRNLDLLVANLTQSGGGRQVLAVGFADNAGNAPANQALSQARAVSVQRYLTDHGVTGVAVTAFGDALPVDTNDTPEGRQQNRRVELWLR